MIWSWWGSMALAGIVVGCLGAFAQHALRVFMKTLAVPLLLLITRLALPGIAPVKNGPFYIFLDFVIIASTALLSDYLLGWKLGRNDRAGFRVDSIGH